MDRRKIVKWQRIKWPMLNKGIEVFVGEHTFCLYEFVGAGG